MLIRIYSVGVWNLEFTGQYDNESNEIRIYSVGVWNARFLDRVVPQKSIRIYSVGVWNSSASSISSIWLILEFTPLEFETFLYPL